MYAPGLEPMDFRAVAEALVDGRWRVADATLLAPRAGLVRIAGPGDAAGPARCGEAGNGIPETWCGSFRGCGPGGS